MPECDRCSAAMEWVHSLGRRTRPFRENDDRQAIGDAGGGALQKAGGIIIGDVAGGDQHRCDKGVSPEGFFDDAIGLGEKGDEDHDVEQGRVVGDDHHWSLGSWGRGLVDGQDAAEAEKAEEESELRGEQAAHPDAAAFRVAAAEENQG